ncbi:MAG TPA: YdcF family protein, partial [Dokdonella sp.]
MADVAENLGVPASSIRAELASTTTWENATAVRALEPSSPARIWLVTSALHMPRALLAFRAAGFEPCAYPGDYRGAPLEGPTDFLPSAGAIGNTDAVLHEWAGEIAYRIRMWRRT